MYERLSSMARRLRKGQKVAADRWQKLSMVEQCAVALAAGRYDLLPETCPDPVEAWHHLPAEWQLSVCFHRGWPEQWVWEETARPLADLAQAWATLTELRVPWRARLYLHSVSGRIRYLAAQRDRLREEVERLGGDPPDWTK